MPAQTAGGTTLSEESRAELSVESRGLALVWSFPELGRGYVNLRWESPAELYLGREEGCDVCLPGKEVSRRHAVLRRTATSATITDLGSRNGTRVNGERVAGAELSLGDVVRIGGWVGVVSDAPGRFEEIAPGLFGGQLLKRELATLKKAAPSELPVVLEGETGTGKELAARSLHLWSGRRGSFLAVNCAALPEGLAEAQLFGHRRGAFTGADRASAGLFRDAHGGTLLLDEVSDLPLGVQAKLLRVLEQREVQPLGETQPVAVDVRVVVAGQESLAAAVQDRRFRGDLLARLNGVTVRLPPLRQRREDVAPLFQQLLSDMKGAAAPTLGADLIEKLAVHDWSFNVRELVLLVKRLLVFHGDESAWHAKHLPPELANRAGEAGARPSASDSTNASRPRAATLKELMLALQESGGNVTRAAATLGITRQRAYRLMERSSVDLESLRRDED